MTTRPNQRPQAGGIAHKPEEAHRFSSDILFSYFYLILFITLVLRFASEFILSLVLFDFDDFYYFSRFTFYFRPFVVFIFIFICSKSIYFVSIFCLSPHLVRPLDCTPDLYDFTRTLVLFSFAIIFKEFCSVN